MNTEPYLIGDLAQKAGVTVRTIRYYISEGLLPSPQVRGRYSVYDEDYLKRIRLIQRLKEAYLPIKEIRRKLETETEEEIEEFLKMYESTPRPGGAALNYLADIDQEINFTLKPQLAFYNKNIEPSEIRMVLEPEEELPKGEGLGTSWRRFVISRGLELHLSDEVYTHHKADIPAWLEEFRKWLKRSKKD
jgi:DNA-binding transcriptional MerR regulator